MMDDRDIEALLEKYRPAQPPPELQVSIHQITNSIHQITNSPTHQLTWPWALAAAALLAITIGLHGTASVKTAAPDNPIVAQLATDLGGDATAWQLARAVAPPPPAASLDDPFATIQ